MLLALHYGFTVSKIIYLHTHGSPSAVAESSNGTHNAIIFNEIWQHSAVNIVRNYTESKHFIAIFNEILGYSMDAARTKHEIYAHICERMGVILLPLSVPLANTKNIEPKFLRLIEMSKEHTDYEQEICHATEVGVKAWHHNDFHNLNAYIIFMLCELILEKSIHIYGNILVNSNEVKFEPVQFLLDKFVRHLDDKYRNALQEYKKHNSYIVKYMNIIDIMAYNPNESNLMNFLCDNYTRDDVIICSFDFMTSLGGVDKKFGENKIKGDKMKINTRNLQRAYDTISDMSHWLNVLKFSTALSLFVRTEPVLLYSSYYYASDLLFYNNLHKEQYMNFAKLSVKLNDKIIEMFKSAFKTNQ